MKLNGTHFCKGRSFLGINSKGSETMKSPINITRFAGREASVNAWIVSNASHSLLIDALRSESEAEELAGVIAATGKTLWAILVTHGHPDHYIGLRVLNEHFPQARILVAREEIKADIIGFSSWMESVGWLDGIARMKVKSEANPDGFDYAARIEVIDTDDITLPGGGTLDINASYPAMECSHMTTLHMPEACALFTADLVYNGVHPWLGQGVGLAEIAAWSQSIADLKMQYGRSGVTIYPGHGAAGGPELLDHIRTYLSDFVAAANVAESNDALTARISALYPGAEQADFLLAYSVLNHGPEKTA